MPDTFNPFKLLDPSQLTEQLQSMFSTSSLAGFDPNALLKNSQGTIEALVNANRKVVEGYQALIQRQLELTQEMMSETSTLMQSLSQPGSSLQDATAAQAELARLSVERSVSGMRELADMATSSYRAAMDEIHDRVKANLDDLRKLTKPAA